jgi:uncharacterized protein (TIGR02757 family)
MNAAELKEFLDEKADHYNRKAFIEKDPVSIPHSFHQKEDIEISGFLTATISWGNRNSIINSAHRMMSLMGNSPFDFTMSSKEQHLDRISSFVHRTYNHIDLRYFLKALRHIYTHHGGLEPIFTQFSTAHSTQTAIHAFRKIFFSLPHPARTGKHIPDPEKGSVAKRINMYLRWMVRCDNRGVDFGLWKNISPAALSCPLDVHSGNVARSLGLISRRQNDTKALNELDNNLRCMDPVDPVKYDFALFGLGVFEKF